MRTTWSHICATTDTRLPIERDDYTRTLWTRDAYGVPTYTNLYGAHPVFVNQKVGQNASANGVFLLNSHGMDVRFPEAGRYIEYSVLGGIVDLFFFAGPTPADVARQGSDVWGKAAEVPYWSLGFHSCKYGYEDIAEVAEVVNNVSRTLLAKGVALIAVHCRRHPSPDAMDGEYPMSLQYSG